MKRLPLHRTDWRVLASALGIAAAALLAWFLTTLTSGWVINSFLTVLRNGQGWESLGVAVVCLFFAAKAFPRNHIVRSFLRAVWAKA